MAVGLTAQHAVTFVATKVSDKSTFKVNLLKIQPRITITIETNYPVIDKEISSLTIRNLKLN